MPRLQITSARALPVTLLLTFVIAFLPGQALGWTRLPAELMRLVMGPFGSLGVSAGQVIRPTPKPPGSNQVIDDEFVRHLQEERDNFERLYLLEQSRVDNLQGQLEQIQKIPLESLAATKALLTANIVLRSPTAGSGSVVLNRGANHGVQPGTVAVYNGVHLMGRVTDDVSGVQCTLLPLTNKANRLIECRVIPKDRPDLRPSEAPRVGLVPTGEGVFTDQPNAAEPIAVGDTVRLDDTSWPTSAQKMIVGVVESVEVNDLDPLRKVIVVRPAYQVSQVTQVVLRIEELDNGNGAEGGGSGGNGS